MLFYAYDDPNDRAYARARSDWLSSFPQYFYWGYVKINEARVSGANYKPLACHEFMHILGFLHVTEDAYVGSKATCIGAEYNAPAIDDEWILKKVYATPLVGE